MTCHYNYIPAFIVTWDFLQNSHHGNSRNIASSSQQLKSQASQENSKNKLSATEAVDRRSNQPLCSSGRYAAAVTHNSQVRISVFLIFKRILDDIWSGSCDCTSLRNLRNCTSSFKTQKFHVEICTKIIFDHFYIRLDKSHIWAHSLITCFLWHCSLGFCNC